jgi:Lhr-like helicase
MITRLSYLLACRPKTGSQTEKCAKMGFRHVFGDAMMAPKVFQIQAISHVLHGHDTMVIVPTGAGTTHS